MDFLNVQNLSKSFGGLVVIQDLSFSVNEGEILGVIGPNGSGKTTLFNLITGSLKPDSGEVRFKGERITTLKPFQVVNRGIARTFQLVDLFKEMTVLENVMIPCFSHRARSHPGHGKKPWEVAIHCLGQMGLTHRYKELAKNLPFGELRLLDIARALATEPELLLLDEPFSGLDVKDAAVLTKVIQGMYRNGHTIVIIEHRLSDLLKLVERVVVIVFGEKVTEGAPGEVMKNEKVLTAYLGEGRKGVVPSRSEKHPGPLQ